MIFTDSQAKDLRKKIREGSIRPDGEDGCWVWRGATLTGYGVMRVGGVLLLARRVSYQAHRVGPVLTGMVVRCRCRNRLCVNPSHLYLGKGRAGGSRVGHAGKSRGSPYPWTEWFARGRVTLVRGRDYHGLSRIMASQTRGAAAARGLLVSIKVGNGSIRVAVRSENGR